MNHPMRESAVDKDSHIEVFSTPNPSEAYLLKDLLGDAGIRAVVVDDLIQAGGAQLPHPRVCVHQRDQAMADVIVAEWKHPTATPTSTWTCPKCREEIDDIFDVCWLCGTTIEGTTHPDFRSKNVAIENSKQDRCLCPRCHTDVDEDATQCSKCGERFPAMADRRALNTPETFNAFRWLVLATAIVIAIAAIGERMVHFIFSLFAIGD